MFAPNINPNAFRKLIKPAFTKPNINTLAADEDCMAVVKRVPVTIVEKLFLVSLFNVRLKFDPDKACKFSLNNFIAKMNNAIAPKSCKICMIRCINDELTTKISTLM